jgi:GNAT superfamily N-acetyltransferase
MANATDITVRAARPSDWMSVRTLCLESCNEPPFYLTRNESWATNGQDDWVEYSVGPKHAMFLLFDPSVSPLEVVGKARISEANGDPTTAVADGIYIRPAYRGLGLSKLLWQARIHWARCNQFRCITTIHHLSNVRSMRSILAHGFVETERIYHDSTPDAKEPEVGYELRLDELASDSENGFGA